MTYGLGRAFDFNKAHTAVSSNGKPLMVTEAGNLNASLLASLVDCVGAVNLYLMYAKGQNEDSNERRRLELTVTGLPST